MTLDEAEKKGCPYRIIHKMKNAGIVSFSTPHTDNFDWEKIDKDIVFLMSGKGSLIEPDDPIMTRFEILDIR